MFLLRVYQWILGLCLLLPPPLVPPSILVCHPPTPKLIHAINPVPSMLGMVGVMILGRGGGGEGNMKAILFWQKVQAYSHPIHPLLTYKIASIISTFLTFVDRTITSKKYLLLSPCPLVLTPPPPYTVMYHFLSFWKYDHGPMCNPYATHVLYLTIHF